MIYNYEYVTNLLSRDQLDDGKQLGCEPRSSAACKVLALALYTGLKVSQCA